MERWSELAKKEVKAAYQHDTPILLNSLPRFLDKLIEALNFSSQSRNATSDNELSFDHGVQRAKIGSYTLNQVLKEYELLQEVIFDSLKGGAPLLFEEYTTISKSFLSATNDAACSFVRTMAEQQNDSEIQFKRLVEDAKDIAIFILSPEGIVRTWNEGATRIKRFSSEDVIGHHYRMLFREEDRIEGRPERNLKLALTNGRHEEQWWRIRKDGTSWWAEAVLSAFYSPSGKLLGVAKIVRDLTEKKIADDQLREAKLQAEEASQLKSTFVAHMSHEIRTPLGAILGFADILKDSDLNPDEREQFAEVIERNGKTLLRLVDDILDISKIEAGKIEFEYSEIPIRHLLPEVIALFELKAREKGVRIDFDIDRDAPEYITTDSVRLRQIVSNLLSNAVKFIEKGSIQVMVGPIKQTEKAIEGLEILVADSGPGIAKENMSRIFGEFNQADVSVTRKYGGTGLGLALSRKLARELGGDLEMIDCPAEVGCTFKITIVDRKFVKTQSPSEINKNIEGWKKSQKEEIVYPHLKGSRVLIVDDSSDNQLLAKRLLLKIGAQVETANNGAEAVEKAEAGDFDVVLMDVQMPIMDGNQAIKELRSHGYQKPIIALTAHAMMEDRMKSFNAGCNDYLSKPIDSKQLYSLLEKWSHSEHH